MPVQTVGNQSFIDGKPIEPGTLSHSDASRAAKEHGQKVAAGRTSSVAFEPSVGVELFFNSKDFEPYIEKPPEAAAVAAAIREASAAGADDDALAEVAAKPAAEHAAEQAREVLAKQMPEDFRHGGQLHAAKSWIVQDDSGHVEVVADDDFASRFITKTETGTAKKSPAPAKSKTTEQGTGGRD